MTTAYPLAWPLGYPRTASPKSSKFSTSVSGAVKNVLDELRRFGKDSGKPVADVLVSSNVTLVDQRPKDAGVAVYFRWDGIDCALAVDVYSRPEDNLQAIAKVVDAQRTMLRHGGLNIVRASFRGFAALPPAKGPDGHLPRPWWQVLGVPQASSLDAAEQAYRNVVKKAHPDRGGDPAAFNAATDAIRQARIELQA